jgi:16S rRNA (uracil1498-N3)-methyltransferase
VNLILFEPSEIGHPLPLNDRRAVHILSVLKRQTGETCDVGLINGVRGKATVAEITTHGIALTFTWSTQLVPADPVTLIVGLPRPQTAKDILRDATALGVASLHFVRTEKSDVNYGQSTLWTSGEWRRHAIAGAEQAFDTRVPEVTFTRTLLDVLAVLGSASVRVALDNYESPWRLGELSFAEDTHHVLAIGGERGWSGRDRDQLRAHQFTFAHLGARILRTESAIVAALSILRAKRGWM